MLFLFLFSCEGAWQGWNCLYEWTVRNSLPLDVAVHTVIYSITPTKETWQRHGRNALEKMNHESEQSSGKKKKNKATMLYYVTYRHGNYYRTQWRITMPAYRYLSGKKRKTKTKKEKKWNENKNERWSETRKKKRNNGQGLGRKSLRIDELTHK